MDCHICGDPITEAIWVVQNCMPEQLRFGAFSGGKDSIALHEICKMAGVNLEWHYHNTTIDPPEVCHFIRDHYPHVIWDKPKHGNFFVRARAKGVLPSFKRRWCCDEYKESRGPLNAVWIVGERREESPARSVEPVVGLHRRTRRVLVRPLANWDSEFLWRFIRDRGLAYPSLYDEGFTRLGCVGCPLASRGNRERQMARWPKIGRKWVELARRHYEKRVSWDNFDSFEEFFNAWMDRRF